MENKTLNNALMMITKENNKLKNKLDSQLENTKQEGKKFTDSMILNNKLKEEISMIRENLENINNSHSKKCQEIKDLNEINSELKLTVNNLKSQITQLKIERSSYKSAIDESKRNHDKFLVCYGNETKYIQRIEGIQRVMKDSNNNLTSIKGEFKEVTI